jgi:DNA modification methylase
MKCYRCGEWDGERCSCKDGQTIFNGDCREILPELPKVDLVLTDPPYGIGAHGGIGKYGREREEKKEHSAWDSARPDDWTIKAVVEAGADCCIWGGNYFNLPGSRMYLVWDKGAGFKGRDFAECETAWCSWDGNARIYQRDPLACGDYHNGKKQHPTQKPEAVMKWALMQRRAETVLDPFMGSGTTLRACKDLGRRGIGIELEEKYCEIASERLRQGVLC